MKQLLKIIQENKLLIGLIVVLSVSLIVVYWWTNRDYTGPTGGVGQPKQNTVIIAGWDQKNQDQVELGSVISDKQQQTLTNEISRLLVKDQGEFDHRNAQIEQPIESIYDKKAGTDQTIFHLTVEKTARYKVTLNHNDDSVTIQKLSK